MTDSGGPVELPTAGVRRRRRIPLIWIVPLVTALIALWLAWDTFPSAGRPSPSPSIAPKDCRAGQSQLKFKDVEAGHGEEHRRDAGPRQGPRHDRDDPRGGAAAHRQDDLLGRQAAALRRQCLGPRYAALGLLCRHAAAATQAQARFIGRQDPPVLEATCRGPPSSSTGNGWARSPSARRCSTAISRSARCSAGTSATWPAASRSTPSCVRRSTNTCTTIDVLERLRHLGEAGGQRRRATAWNCCGRCCWAASPSIRRPAPARRPPPGPVVPAVSQPEAARSAGYGRQIRIPVATSPARWRASTSGADVTLHGLKIGEVTDVGLIYDPKLDRIVAPCTTASKPSASPRRAADRLPPARSPPRWSGAASAPPCRRRA